MPSPSHRLAAPRPILWLAPLLGVAAVVVVLVRRSDADPTWIRQVGTSPDVPVADEDEEVVVRTGQVGPLAFHVGRTGGATGESLPVDG